MATTEIFNWSARTIEGTNKVVLSGTVMHHPKLPNYTKINRTSPVVAVYFELNRYTVETASGTRYKLGVTDAAWERHHPNGRWTLIHNFLRVKLAAEAPIL